MADIAFQEESFSTLYDEAWPLLVRHWNEIALNKDTVALEPDIDVYKALEASGALHITTARADGVLVGYAAFLMMDHLHYKSLRIADGDIYWLAPEHRKGMTGVRLLRTAERHLAAKGVDVIANKVKLGLDVGPVFERMGYTPIERVYTKRIG